MPFFIPSKLLRYFLATLIGWVLMVQPAWAETRSTHFQLLQEQAETRFLLDLSGKTDYKVFLLKNPDRLVIDLKNNLWTIPSTLVYTPKQQAVVTSLRHGIQEGVHARIVLDLSQEVRIVSEGIYPLNGGNSYRLEVKFATVAPLPKPVAAAAAPPAKVAAPIATPAPVKIPVIVIDPGHGGDDPGALGRVTGEHEKNITLTYGLALKEALEKETGYKVVLTRKDDRFIPLGERVEISRRAKGDLFISLHANTHPKESMMGLSVYTVSDTASDKEAELLAMSENKEETLKNINISAENEEVAPVLINLMQRDTKNVSASFAEDAVAELGKEVVLLRNTHRFAGFKVLKGVDVPAVLFELGYLSNKEEERLLSSPAHQKKIIAAMVRAINTHFNKKTILAKQP